MFQSVYEFKGDPGRGLDLGVSPEVDGGVRPGRGRDRRRVESEDETTHWGRRVGGR